MISGDRADPFDRMGRGNITLCPAGRPCPPAPLVGIADLAAEPATV